MASRFARVLRKSPRDLFTSALRVGGTRLFTMAVAVLRWCHVLPPAYVPGRDAESILMVALTPHLGDAVMLTPFLQALKRANPDIPVDLAVERGAGPILQGMPELRAVYQLDLGSTPPVSTAATILRVGAVVREYWKYMRGCRPAVCVMPRWGDDLFRSFYLAVLTGAPRRIGFAASVGAPRYRLAAYRDRLLTEAYGGGSGLHETARFLHLLEEARLAPAGTANREASATSGAVLDLASAVPWEPLATRLGLHAGEPFAVIAPGASQPKKVWPAQRWCEVIEHMRANGRHVVLLSGAADAEIARGVQACGGPGTTLVAGITSLAESAAVMQHADLFLGSDSGPAHLAGAVGTPTVVLFAASLQADEDDPFSPARNRPMGPHVYTCLPETSLFPCVNTCEADVPHCIEQITVADVVRQVTKAAGKKVPV